MKPSLTDSLNFLFFLFRSPTHIKKKTLSRGIPVTTRLQTPVSAARCCESASVKPFFLAILSFVLLLALSVAFGAPRLQRFPDTLFSLFPYFCSLLRPLAVFFPQVPRDGQSDKFCFWKRVSENGAEFTSIVGRFEGAPVDLRWQLQDTAQTLAASLQEFAARHPEISLHGFPVPPIVQQLQGRSAPSHAAES